MADLGQAKDRLARALVERLEAYEQWHAKVAHLDMAQLDHAMVEVPAA